MNRSDAPTRTTAAAFAVALAWLCAIGLTVWSPSTSDAYQKPKGGPPRQRARPARPKSGTGNTPVEPKKSEDNDPDASQDRRKLSDLKAEGTLPHLRSIEVPTVEQLHKMPVDWLVLKGGTRGNESVLAVRQVFPRPETLLKLQRALEQLRSKPRPTDEEERDKLAAQRDELQHLTVTLPDEAAEIYEIPTDVIDHIIYHEDLIIRRATMLADEKNFREAYELLFVLARQAPGWKGLEERMQRILFAEAENALAQKDLESAYTFLEELQGRNRQFPDLQAHLGETTDRLIRAAQEAHDVRRARYFVERLARIEPKHEIVGKWTDELLVAAQRELKEAQAASAGGRHDEAVTVIERAGRTWPQAPGLKEAYRRINDRFQRLEAGVLDLPGDPAQRPFPTLAERRETRLKRFDLFEVDRVDDAVHYRSRLIEQWEPTDLGRRALFSLKATAARWESRPILTAPAVLGTMEPLLDPASPTYDERLASYVDSVHVRSPFEFEIRFTRTPPRTEALLRFPIKAKGGPSPGSPDGSTGTVLSSRFEKTHGNETESVYRRVIPEPDGLREYHTAEVRERKYDSPELAIQALLRGDVSLLPDLPTWATVSLREDPRFFVLDYAMATTHVLQFNPRSDPLKSRELRMAMAYAIDDRRILSRIVLRDPNFQFGRLTTAPFSTRSDAYNTLVPRREHNASIAYALAAAASKRLKAIPVLRLICDPGVASQAAAKELVVEWKRVGIRVEIVPGASALQPGSWDVAYRTLRMEEPLVELWPFLAADSRARLGSNDNIPDWLRQELLQLDNAPDWKSALVRLQQLQAHLYDEVEYIPLWEVDDAVVLRKTIHDFPPLKLVDAYQDVERWVIEPSMQEDVP